MKIDPMEAITLWQPWASLIAIGAKKYETRGWATSYRGPIAIHAAKKEAHTIFNAGLIDDRAFRQAMKLIGAETSAQLPYGCIIATAELIGVHSIREYADGSAPFLAVASDGSMAPVKHLHAYKIREIDEREQLFGDFSEGRYAWELANVQMLDEPIPAKGRQGLWTWEGVA